MAIYTGTKLDKGMLYAFYMDSEHSIPGMHIIGEVQSVEHARARINAWVAMNARKSQEQKKSDDAKAA